MAISGLIPGQIYWAVPLTSDTTGQTFQLSATPGGSPIELSASTAAINFKFDPVVQIDPDKNTVNVGFNIGDPLTNFPHSGTPLTYQGAFGFSFSGLQQGQTYYAILDPNPFGKNVLFLASTVEDAANAYTEGKTSYDAAYAQALKDTMVM